jgi:hypothetical protein
MPTTIANSGNRRVSRPAAPIPTDIDRMGSGIKSIKEAGRVSPP